MRVNQAPIMVVDDDAAIRELMRVLLGVEGVPTVLAANGNEALAKLDEGPLPRIILLDYMMPEMNGGEFLERFRKHPEWSHIKIYMFTAFDSSRVPEGVQVLSKPVNYDEIVALVRADDTA